MICEAVDFYATILDKEKLASELRSWNYKWRNAAQVDTALPMNALTSLEHCSVAFYPNIRKLLTILATLPVTTSSAERSFSTLRRLKTYLRSTMANERLASLALLHIHKDISVSAEEVVDRFAVCKTRRFEL